LNVGFLDPAKSEFLEAIAYYNQQREGLGYEFAAEVQRTIGRIKQFPQAWPKLSSRTRRCRTNRFPYSVLYQVRSNALLIVAVMHQHRHPESWRNRLKRQKL
jgi:plasmid stabilization system protein ParE